ncbi:MAG: hypothetical protein ACK5TO_13310 [Planctomycetaceae bacterium]|jgi:hypothetical protein
MTDSQHFVAGIVPERFVEVDAARLLLILHHFSTPVDDTLKETKFHPLRNVDPSFRTSRFEIPGISGRLRSEGWLTSSNGLSGQAGLYAGAP